MMNLIRSWKGLSRVKNYFHILLLLTHLIPFNIIIAEKIAWDQAAWSEAAKTDPDFLNLDEFLSFRHPESSHSSLLSKADDLIGEYGTVSVLKFRFVIIRIIVLFY